MNSTYLDNFTLEFSYIRNSPKMDKLNYTALGSTPPNQFEQTIAILASFLAIALALICGQYIFLDNFSTSTNSLTNGLIFQGIVAFFVVVAVVIIRFTLRISNANPKINSKSNSHIAKMFFGLYFLFVAAWPLIIEPLFPSLKPSIPETYENYDLYKILLILIAAPILEEFIFRRVSYDMFSLFNLPLPTHLVLVSILFSFFHLIVIYGLDLYSQAYWFAYFFVCSGCFHLVRFYSGKLWPCIAVHSAHNCLALTLMPIV